MQKIGLIGYGRFGKLWAEMLSSHFKVMVYDSQPRIPKNGVEIVPIHQVIATDTLFLAVPISSFKSVVEEIAPSLRPGTTVLDVCSVKVYPATVMLEHFAPEIGIIATHPLFGPDSYQPDKSRKIMMHPTRDTYHRFPFWKKFFQKLGLQVVEMTPEEHDKLAAETQGITHFLGRMLQAAGVKRTPIDTQGFLDLLDLMEQTCHDSWELFMDLQTFNPHTPEVLARLEKALKNVRDTILKGA